MKKLLPLLLLIVTFAQASGYEHAFNWANYADQLPVSVQGSLTLAELPKDGINFLIHPTEVPWDITDGVPNLQVWNNGDYDTNLPFVNPIGRYQVALEGQEDNKQTFYLYHFDAPSDNLKIKASFNGNYIKGCEQNGKDREFLAPGTYFFNYAPYSSLQ